MSHHPKSRRGRFGWVTSLALTLTLLIFVLTGYTSYSVYGIVRDSVSQTTNLPSFEVLSRQAGLSLQQPVAVSTMEIRSSSDSPEPSSAPPEMDASYQELQGERINILLLGIDQRAGEVGPFRTDMIIVLTIDLQSGSAGMLSIPRDLWVPIPGYNENRINTAHFTGDLKKYPGGGPALAKKTVSYNFGFPVHYYVRLNFEGFKQIIDTIGGIDIDVPNEIRDDRFPDDQHGYAPLYIPAGRIHMDGDLALKYSRTRKADSDFHRVRRQQQVILAVKDKILDLNLLPSLIPKIPELTAQLSDAVQTDIPIDDIIRLAKLTRYINLEDIKPAVIDESMTIPTQTPTGAEVLLPIRDTIRPVVDDLFWSPLPTLVPAETE